MSIAISKELRQAMGVDSYEQYRFLMDMIYSAGVEKSDHWNAKEHVDEMLVTLIRRCEAEASLRVLENVYADDGSPIMYLAEDGNTYTHDNAIAREQQRKTGDRS